MNRTTSSESVDSLYEALQEQLKAYESNPNMNLLVPTQDGYYLEDEINSSLSSSQKTIQTSEVSTQTSSSPMFLYERDDEPDEHIHYSDSMNSETSPLPTIEMIDLTTPSPDQSCSSEDQTDIMQIDCSPIELSSK